MVGLRSLLPLLLLSSRTAAALHRLAPRNESDAAASLDDDFEEALEEATLLAQPGPSAANNFGCRCFPGDLCWPSDALWTAFNRTLVGGRLVKTVPIGSACHDNPWVPYNSAECARVQGAWADPDLHTSSSSSVMAPFFANMSCDPFTARGERCILGTYVRYAVKATSALDVKLTVLFALANNIRLVIRNTGHDFFGKSTGAGALAVWTHHLKDIKVHDYSSAAYKGKALTVGAGVQVKEALEAAHAKGLVIVGGDSSSVGLAGGYTQGGGHGPLVSKFGLAADQVLEWEVVTATGLQIKASATQNSDLYWALSGGGGGTYGIVVSATIKAHPDSQVTVASLSFFNPDQTSDAFYNTIKIFLASLTNIIDSGAVAIWLLTNEIFMIQSITAPGKSAAEVRSWLNTTFERLEVEEIPYNFDVKEFPTFLDSYHSMSPEPAVTAGNFGGRLLPRSLLKDKCTIRKLVNNLRFIVEEGGLISGLSVNVGKKPSIPNAVNPAWRDTAISAVIGSYWKEGSIEANVKDQEWIRNKLVPKLAELTPGGAAYLNEADFGQPEWQKVFYGANYNRLRSIKRKYDPLDTFYGLTAVGSEDWESRPDGRLCRAW